MRFEPPKQFEIDDRQPGAYPNKIEEIMSKETPQIICCATMNDNSERYAAIKKKCAIDRPTPSQVVCMKSIKKGLSVVTKIVIQMNSKLGGIPWTVDIHMKGLMVIGYDVCRDKVNRRVYGKINKTCYKYLTFITYK